MGKDALSIAGTLVGSTLFFISSFYYRKDPPFDKVRQPLRGTLADVSLTPRECEVWLKLCEGKSNKRIAAELFISESTVKKHVGSILEKCGCRSRTELLARIVG